MRHTDWLRLGAAALALALAGCGGAKSDNASATSDTGAEETAAAAKPNIDPCSLITTQEVAAITGGAVDQAVRQDDSCSYRSEGRGEDGVQVLYSFTDGAREMRGFKGAADVIGGMSGYAATQGAAGKDAAAMMKKDGSAAPKIGDEAAWGMNTAIGVRKGTIFFQVMPPVLRLGPPKPGVMPLLNVEEKRDIVSRVAEKVASRLPG